MKIIVSESQYRNLVLEYYDSEKLYSRNYVVEKLKYAPKELRKHIKNLPYIEHTNDQGESKILTKIPEVVYVFLFGNY